MTRTLTLLGLLAVTAVTLADDKADPAAKLVGMYMIVSGERDGEKIKPEEIRGALVKFTNDRIVATDVEKKEFYAATYTLDSASKPWRITMLSTIPKSGEKAIGVIEMADDTVTLCYQLPGGMPPTGLKAGEKQQCFVLKRVTGKKE